MARPSGGYWCVGMYSTMVLVYAVGAVLSVATGIEWLQAVGAALPLMVVLALWGTFYWLARGGRGPTVVGAVMIPLNVVAYAVPVLVHRAICRLRAAIGPSRDLFRGVTDLRSGHVEQAVAAFERHLRREPADMRALAPAAFAFVKLGRHDDALRYLDAAVARDGNDEALATRSTVLAFLGAADDGLSDIDGVLARRPKDTRCHYLRALALLEGGRVDEALEELKGPAMPKRYPLSWYLLSLALPQKGDMAAAADAHKRAVAIIRMTRPFHPFPWDLLPEARLFAQTGKLDRAEEAAARTLDRNPGDHEALAIQALVDTRRGETEDALRTLEEAGRKNPFLVVGAARDRFFAPLSASPGFPALLERATREWEARLFAIRHRPGIAANGA